MYKRRVLCVAGVGPQGAEKFAAGEIQDALVAAWCAASDLFGATRFSRARYGGTYLRRYGAFKGHCEHFVSVFDTEYRQT